MTDPQTVATIRNLAARGTTRRELVKQYNLARGTVDAIVNRTGAYVSKARAKPPESEIVPYDRRQGLRDCPKCRRWVLLPNQKRYPGYPCVGCQVRATMGRS